MITVFIQRDEINKLISFIRIAMLPYHMSELELKKSNKTMSMDAINNNKRNKHELKFQTFIIHSEYIFQR